MKKIMFMTLCITMSAYSLFSQTAEDALRYSRIYYSGTARFNGLSGAFGAVGADFSTLATNPAGIGLYQAYEMSLTIAPTIGSTTSTYNGYETSDNRVNVGMGNFGVIFNLKPSAKSNNSILKNFNIGFGFNRQNDFNNTTYISGVNSKNSLMQNYTNVLNDMGIQPGDISYDNSLAFDVALAWNANLIGYDSTTRSYYCDAPYGGVAQSKTINTYGSINEMDFSMGGNVNDRLYFGLTLGVPTLRYYENSIYQETAVRGSIPNFLSLKYRYNLQTQGTGINVKFGIIYRPANWVRIGASIHTPTWYPRMQDEWFSSMQSTFTNPNWNSTQNSPEGYYNYQLRTPFRAMGSLAFIIGKYGLVSADYEYVNYSQARFSSSEDSYSDVNNDIKTNYQSWGNLRFGTEWRILDFRVRGGFAYFSNPYTQSTNNSERFQVSGGIGYRASHFFADVSYVWTKMNQDYYLYDPSMVNPAHLTQYTNTVSTTIGFRF
ncbi:MAG: hypothetical protein PHF97_10195 [Bacteroidales bacterium]|nr:hypothetical protein [Bacteroidales bacterium]